MLTEVTITTSSADETRAVGVRLAPALRAGDVVLLHGPLGAGKTVVVRGLVHGLDPAAAALVSSQSYVVAGEYPTRPRVVHLDLYRLRRVDEVLALGYEELLYGEGKLAVVEWPDLIEPLLESDDPVLRVRLEPGDTPDSRVIRLATDVPRIADAARRAASDE